MSAHSSATARALLIEALSTARAHLGVAAAHVLNPEKLEQHLQRADEAFSLILERALDVERAERQEREDLEEALRTERNPDVRRRILKRLGRPPIT